MTLKKVALVAPLALGLLLLLWIALSVRERRPPVVGIPAKKNFAGSARSIDDDPAVPVVAARAPETPPPVRGKDPERPAPTPSVADKLAAEQRAEESARSRALWRIKSWESLLGLTDAQKQSLTVLLTRWEHEDAEGRPGRDTWLARESELRSQFTIEQALRLHDSVVAEAQMHWGYMASKISLRVGASPEQRSMFQESLGAIRFPESMILPEACDGDYTSLLRVAATRVRPGLSPDQVARLDQLGGR